nr:unnamed protein product [Callosobruchus chinensis]
MAFNFGNICSAKTEKILKEFPALKYGRDKEKLALKQYCYMYSNKNIFLSSLVVDQNLLFLACSPNALVDDDEDNQGQFRKSHRYFYQIQGVLNITQRAWCNLVIYSREEIVVIRVDKDVGFWEKVMCPALEDFYLFYFLPKLGRKNRRIDTCLHALFKLMRDLMMKKIKRDNFRLCRLEKRSIIGPGQRFPVTWLKKTNNDGEYILSCKGMIQSDKILCEVNLQKIDRFRYRMDSSHRTFVNDGVKYYHEQFLTEQQGECDPTKRNTPGNFTGTISDGYDTNGGKTPNESSPKVITLQNVILKPADTVQGEKEKTSGSDMSQDSGRNHQPSSKESDEWNAKKLVLENESETDTHLGVENKSPEESVFQDSGSEYTPSPKKTKNKNTSKWVSENRKFVIQKKKQKLKSSQTGSKKSEAGDFNDNGYKMFTNESMDKLDASEDHSEENDLCNAELTTHIQEIGNFDVPDKNNNVTVIPLETTVVNMLIIKKHVLVKILLFQKGVIEKAER